MAAKFGSTSSRNSPFCLSVGDDLGDEVIRPPDLGQVGAPEGVGRPRDLDDDHLHQLGLVPVGLDDEVRDAGELVARRDVAGPDLLARLDEQRPALGEELVEHLVLGVEVVVDEPVGDARLGRDVRDAGRVKALAGEDRDRGVEDRAALVGGGSLAHQGAPFAIAGSAVEARCVGRPRPLASGRPRGGGAVATGACRECRPGSRSRVRPRRSTRCQGPAPAPPPTGRRSSSGRSCGSAAERQPIWPAATMKTWSSIARARIRTSQ